MSGSLALKIKKFRRDQKSQTQSLLSYHRREKPEISEQRLVTARKEQLQERSDIWASRGSEMKEWGPWAQWTKHVTSYRPQYIFSMLSLHFLIGFLELKWENQ